MTNRTCIAAALFTLRVCSFIQSCGDSATDIPQDFKAKPHVVVRVPYGAQYIFLCASDSQYYDNYDVGAGYGAQISIVWMKDPN
jgi:hypothetical protein